MVYQLNEASEKIEWLNGNGTLYNGKIWSVEGGKTRFSDDWGDTYTELANNLPSYSVGYHTHFTKSGTMIVSKNKDVYRAEEPYTDFTYVLGLHTTQSVVRRWGFTEDNDNILFMTEYGNYPNPEGSGYLNIMYWYKSEDEGLTWTKHDNLKQTDGKHFHQLKVDPLTNNLYITTGDDNKRVFKSTNKGETWQEVIPATYPNQTSENINYGGHTGLAFFSTGEILWGTDWQPRNPETGDFWNWFVRSQGDNVNSFIYQKIEKKHYGMTSDINTDYYTGEAWTSLSDEFNESDVHPVLMYTKNKGISWEPLVELPAESNLVASGLIAYADNTIKDSPYIFWNIVNYGVVRISRDLKPEIPEVKPSNAINEVEFFINQNNKIYEIELFNREGSIKYNSAYVGR